MGLDIQSLRFLLRSKETVSLGRFIMLGRQGCHVTESQLRAELTRKLPKSDSPRIESAIAKTLQSGFIEPVVELLGAESAHSLDFSDYERATIVHDINNPVPEELKGAYSCVYDGGTLEHVFDFPRAIGNVMEMVRPGGHMLIVSPTNNFSGHGFYQFSPELYWRIFSSENGYQVEEISVCEHGRHAPSYRIPNPVEVGGRIQFTNSRPTYVMVRARRISQTEISKTVPQQIYYEEAWSSGTTAKNAERPKSARERAKSLPEPLKKLLRPFAPQVRRLRFSGFEKI